MELITRSDAKKRGLPRYFTGKVCCAGHCVERYTSAGNCVECLRLTYWKSINKDAPPLKAPFTAEEVRRRAAAYAFRKYQENPDKARRKQREWREKNLAVLNERSKMRYAANPEKYREASKKSWSKNPEPAKARHREWTRNNRDKMRVLENNRRDKKANDKLSPGIVNKLLVLQKGKCPVCRKNLGQRYHIDHVMPFAKGGKNVDDNVQLLCARCNHEKHAKHPIAFMQSKGFLL